MTNKKIKFLLREEKELLFDNQRSSVLSNVSPFKEILSKSNYNDLFLSIDEKEQISFNDLFQLRVNIKNIGGFDLFFKQANFNKEDVIRKIIALKEIQVDNLDSAKEKLLALFNIFSESPLFACYSPKGEFKVGLDDIPVDTFVFFVEQVEEPELIKQEKTPVVKRSDTFFGKIADYFSPIAGNPVHYLFILISSFLIGFSSSIGIYYCYVGNNVYYFLLICSFVGALLNFFVYIDYFKKHVLLSRDTVLTALDVLIGIGLSIGSFFIFYVVQKEKPTSLKSPLTILLIMSAVIILVNILTCIISFLLKGFKSKQKESK